MANRTIEPKDIHHFLTVNPPVLSQDVKLARSQLRLYKKQIKNAKEERWLALGREIAVTIPQSLIRETGSVLSSVAQAHGEMFRGWFSNADPLTWAGDAVAVGVYFLLVSNIVRKTGQLVGIADLSKEIGLSDFIDNLPSNVAATVTKDLGRDDKTGIYGVGHTTDDFQRWIASDFRWYTNPTSQSAALVIASLVWPLHAEAVTRSLVGGSEYIPVPSEYRVPNPVPGTWGIMATKDGVDLLIDSNLTYAQASAVLVDFLQNPSLSNVRIVGPL